MSPIAPPIWHPCAASASATLRLPLCKRAKSELTSNQPTQNHRTQKSVTYVPGRKCYLCARTLN